MSLTDRRVVHLARRERQRRQAERRGGRSRRRGWCPAAERDHAERHLARGVEVEEPVQLVVDEAEDHPGREVVGGGEREQVGEDRAAVPEAVAVGPRLVLPAVAPERAGEEDERRGGGGRRLPSRRADDGLAVVAGAEPSQREVVRPEVVDARVEVGKRPAHEVEIDVVERARAGGRPVEHLAARIGRAAEHARTEVEEAGERRAVEPWSRAGGRARVGDRGERGPRRGRDVARQGDRLEVRIDLERPRHDVPVEEVRACAHALERVLGALVVAARGGRVRAGHVGPRLHGRVRGEQGARRHLTQPAGRRTARRGMACMPQLG